MPDLFDATGLTVETATEITAILTSGLQGIYGADINTDQNSPDGQAIGIQTQTGVDVRELLVQINASFDPDQAVGVVLDQRVAINGVTRVVGTYSIYPIDITVNKTVALQGLDANFNDANGTGYTVQDDSGNMFILVDSVTLTAGTTTVDFRAQQIGAVSVPVNTITTPVTIIAGVTSVNNSSAPVSIGETEETDVQLRVRRQNSVANNSSGYLNGLKGTLLGLAGVTAAEVYENVTDVVDANGIKAHGIWAIVAGGSSSDIANAIYVKNAPGTPTTGSITVNETNSNGIIVPIHWDVPSAENLYLKFTIKRTVVGFSFNTSGIAAYIAANLSYEIGAFAETSAPTLSAALAINSLGGGGVPVLMQVSTDNATWTDYVTPATLASEFTLAAAHINITVV